MPNWFYFSLEVEGKEKDVQEFVQNVKGSKEFDTEGSNFDFNHFIPQPDNIFKDNLGEKERKECEEKGVPNWYDWNVTNWGTKWNANVDCEDGEGTNYHTFHISTAWAFPSPIIDVMLDKYSHLSFQIEGEEESQSYGVYIKHDNGNTQWLEEEGLIVDEQNGREIYYKEDKESFCHLAYYKDDDGLVEDQEDFYPGTKYSWS